MMLSLTVRINTAPAAEVRLGVGSASVQVTAELKSLPAGSRDLFYNCIDPVLPPRSEYDLRSLLCKKLRSFLSQAAACAGDSYSPARTKHRDFQDIRSRLHSDTRRTRCGDRDHIDVHV